MYRIQTYRWLPFALSVPLCLFVACGDDDDGATTPDAGPSACGDTVSGNGILKDFDPPCDPGANGVLFTASGEEFAITGYAFPPANADAVAFVDGWEIKYDRVITTFDHVTLSDNPDKSPTDESQTGAVVAEVDGPFAVDLHKGGPLTGASGGGERTVAVAALKGKNKGSTDPFDATMRYAFGFDVVTATAQAKNVNLDADDLAEYQDMIAKGYTTLLVGTATWKGGDSCTSTIADYDFSKIPTTVKFHFGVKAPTSYINAQNPALTGEAFPNEESQRGIQTVTNQSTIAQLTFHLDHFFWESFVHDSPAHFDSFASHYAGATSTPTATMEDFVGVGFKPFKDALGNDVPWRSCVADYTPPTAGAMTFDTLGVPVDPSGDPATTIRDFYDYTVYNHSTFGHLNADGLAFVKRNYPSPP